MQKTINKNVSSQNILKSQLFLQRKNTQVIIIIYIIFPAIALFSLILLHKVRML